jgi:uncharacterized protein YbjT (DUF2867 family)
MLTGMKVVLFGATGMVGQGVLRECLLDPAVEQVLAVGRGGTGLENPKVRDLIHKDFTDFSPIAGDLRGYDACFFCLGVSSAGMKENDYQHVTYDFTLAAATVLAQQNPGAMTFVYVSGTGTDSTERGRSMWARVKGKTENALLKLPFKAAYMFRPGVIQPLHGIKSKTRLYRGLYTAAAPLFPVLKALFPKVLITTEQVGRAMIAAAKHGAPKVLLENSDIAELARGTQRPYPIKC